MALIIRLLVFALAVYLQTATPGVESGYTSLFNGKDLAGWRIGGPAESFTVQDGAIVARGITSHCYYDGSFRNHNFRNFELKVDVMTRPGSNGGVYVLTEFQEVGGRVLLAVIIAPGEVARYVVPKGHDMNLFDVIE